MAEKPKVGSTVAKVRRPTAAFVLSLIAAVLVIIQGIVRLLQSRALEISGVTDKVSSRVLAGLGLGHLGVVALFFGALILVGAIIMCMTTYVLPGALVVLAFSIVSIVAGGLFGLLGFIIGIIGAVLALVWKK